ncbi:PREDICTED: rab3 GTPase-activating protein regulatory subunit [Papilio polytes]|uniref:rab3 GTPase-activating protein regulatory subunit n=1 Tax=Papilio polytes TaxID=76194 RepID=UPI0006764602|nr:PREDICTED: rab3 GTPase-activating protein regulatory subunit [Papilio polytes]
MCTVEQIADCGDILSLGRSLFIPEKEDKNWLSQCSVSLSPCGNLLAVGFKNRLCLLTTQWISAIESNTFILSWSGTLPAEINAILALSICPSSYSSQNGPDWFCIIVGFTNGSIGFYTNTGHLLLLEKLDDKPVMKISCHTGTYGTLPDDIHILFHGCICILSGSSLFQTLRNAKAQLARVQAGVQTNYVIDSRSINIRKWSFAEQELISDASVVGLELKNTFDHFLAASTYGGYDTWYRSIPPVNSLILTVGTSPYTGFHYALEGGTTPPLQDVARAVANKIKSALPGWLGGGSTENMVANPEPIIRSEALSMRNGIYDSQRLGTFVAISPDRRLAALADNLGRVAVLDINSGYIIRLFKGYRDAQCAFVQIFDTDSKKPQLTSIKEIRRAIFLIIYNPKKGLIDIRLMQRGTRVAVFTATKNGQLLYNSCGLVGAEKNYNHKKLNMPEFQCVLIDPDGKLKKFNIPFYYSLEGEHLQRSKDLHVLREIRELMKKVEMLSEESKTEIIQKATNFKTLEIRKHCMDLFIRNTHMPNDVLTTCLEIFWESVQKDNLNCQVQETKLYFAKLALLIFFFTNINGDASDGMEGIVEKVCEDFDLTHTRNEIHNEVEIGRSFHLLEDDSCILERLLILAQENNFKEHHPRVSFVDSNTTSYKEFMSYFVFNKTSKVITLKPDIAADKLDNLAANIFKSILKLKDFSNLTDVVKESHIDSKEIVKLLITHVMNMPLDEINIELIEKLIEILFYLCKVTDDAVNINYNHISPWWQSIRDMLVEMRCPLRSMIVAMACKAVASLFEGNTTGREDAWESVTKENAKWGLLIGKLEDISILSITLMFKGTFMGKTLPKLPVEDFNINLKYIYIRGKGSVTELIAKWLCSMGVPPEAIIANELIDLYSETDADTDDESSESTQLFLENSRAFVDDNQSLFKWISLLRRQFPLSTLADYIIANMCWEYAINWQKCMQANENIKAVLRCLKHISNFHLRLGLFSIIWSTYIKHCFELSCRLVNKVGKLPKDHLCLQDLGFNSEHLKNFLQVVTEYLYDFHLCSTTAVGQEKKVIKYEKIWDESMPSLVEVAQDVKNVDKDILNLNYQMSCTIYYQCHFNVKFPKALDTLFDIEYQYLIEALVGNIVRRDINMKPSGKMLNPRMKFLTKLIRAAVDTITCVNSDEANLVYNNEDCLNWMENISTLAELWNVNENFVKHQYVVGLYHMGYDALAQTVVGSVAEPEMLLVPIVAITVQRLKRNLEKCKNQPEWIVTVPPQLYKRLQNTTLDVSVPANPSLTTTMIILQKLLSQVDKKPYAKTSTNFQDINLAELIVETCEVLIRRNLG